MGVALVKLGIALLTISNPIAWAGAPDNRDLVSTTAYQRIVEKNSCPMITDDDRRNLNKSYRELLERAEDDKLPAICDRAIEDLEVSRVALTEAVERGDSASVDYGMSAIFGSDNPAREGKLEFMVRSCPSGATKFQKIMFALEAGVGLAQLAFPQILALQAVSLGVDSFQAAHRIREDGFNAGTAANLGVTFGKRFYRPLGWVSKLRKGRNIFSFFRKRGKDRQFVDKMLACQTNQIVKAKTEEACSNPLETDDLTLLRDTYMRLADNKADKNAAGFCKQTACLWSFGGLRTDKDWREHTLERFSQLPPPAEIHYDSKGRALDYEKELREGLEKVEDWRDKCSNISDRVLFCDVSCRMGVTRPARPPQQEQQPETDDSGEQLSLETDGTR
ncbi:MAG: hypothetical protein ABL958_10695 [Bdellovibrionia bacterium]